MRLNFSTSWIFRGWITCVLGTFYAQNAVSESQPCDEKHYLEDSRCCIKCGPGFRVFSHCTDSQKTKCVKCDRDAYQPSWTGEKRCIQQKVCDGVKGFLERSENLVAEEPCRCSPGLQCSPINCEYCERIPTCRAGYGLEVFPESTDKRKTCVQCKEGFFSTDNNAEQCKQWTNCKAEGRSEIQPGSAVEDAVCGPPLSGPSWVIVSVLSIITVLCLLILLLFCYKDKLKLLSVNLRSCVQNLKRTRIQQETLAPLYHSGAGGGPGGPKCTPCEMTKLICQAPYSPTGDPLCTFPMPVTDVKVSLPFTGEMTEKEGVKDKIVMEDQSKGSGEPEEVSEEDENSGSVSPLLAGSCVCVIPIHEPLEVGENEDCSQAVSPGTPGACSCGGLDADESGKEEKSDSKRPDKAGESQEKMSTHETGAACSVSLSPPFLHTSSVVPPSSPEFCLPLCQAQVRPEFKSHLTDRSAVKQEGLYRLTSTDSTSTENSTASAMTLVSSLRTSSSVGDLYLDKPTEVSSSQEGPGISWADSRENKLSSGMSELECSPESLHSQLAEPTLTSGQVSGNNNTTFISSGQVMNFSGEVIVVYVSQTSQGSDEVGQDDAFGSPVQEEANETALFFQSSLRSQGDSITHSTLQEETLPVQEVMEERLLGK
ncbi:tumor necrosis factor receptor superfamily member 11A [Parambassis ranga]|uniref:Tumor necrosis factor receptor superfamily member 11A n=1 Tax=Parambassis ranga TaxID=210632 RepID=A0A6P7KI44_9TELE|nr:tumor necrosis factor receptor superfamily member 11A [Parambassis ranga]